MSFWLWAGAILIAFFAFTFLLKRFRNAQTYYIASIIKTKKGTALIERLARLGRVWEVIADVGLIMGFGAVAVDFRFGKKLKIRKRTALFVISVLLLSLLFYFVSSPFFSNNPLVGGWHGFFALSFGIMGFSGFAIMILVSQAADIIPKIIAGKEACPGIAPVIPGVQIPNVPEQFTPPLYVWLALVVILVVHEFSHGILLRRINQKIKSVGLVLIGFIPIAAFVEPDEEKLRKVEELKQLRVFGMGSLANFFSGIAFYLFFIGVIYLLVVPLASPWYSAIYRQSVLGVKIIDVQEKIEFCGTEFKSPAAGILQNGMLLLRVNDENVSNAAKAGKLIMANFYEEMELTVKTSSGAIEVKKIPAHEAALPSFRVADIPNKEFKPPAEYYLFDALLNLFSGFFGWLILLSILVAIVNFLPVVPFDGGRMAILLFAPHLKGLKMKEEDTQKLIARFFIWLVGILIVLNAIPLFL